MSVFNDLMKGMSEAIDHAKGKDIGAIEHIVNHFDFYYDEDSGLWWFDENAGQHYGYDVENQIVFVEWFTLDEEYRCRKWKITEYKYSHSDHRKINHLLRYLSPLVAET